MRGQIQGLPERSHRAERDSTGGVPRTNEWVPVVSQGLTLGEGLVMERRTWSLTWWVRARLRSSASAEGVRGAAEQVMGRGQSAPERGPGTASR